jgi:hypothetical protein
MTQLQLPPHTRERSIEGTAFVNDAETREHLENCSTRIMRFWQTSGNIPITNKMARDYKFSSYASARINEMRTAGVTILSKWVEENGNKVKAFYLGCQCAEPRRDVTGCYLHSQELKVK